MASQAVIDFKAYGLDVKDTSQVKAETINALGRQVVDVLKKYNYCYLRNHGVPSDLTDNYMEASREFFKLPEELKSKVCLDKDYRFGWSSFEATHANPDRIAGDLHEAFNYTPNYDTAWPPIKTFGPLSREFYSAGESLSLRICDALSAGLGLPTGHMRNVHKLVGQKGNLSCIRTNYYPPISSEKIIAGDQARIGEHVDSDTFTLRFQDQIGGLEIENHEGEFIPVDPIPGTVIVHGGSAMKSCSMGALFEAKHRILVPKDDRRYKQKQSLVFYLLPDDDFVISQPTDSFTNEQTRTHRQAWEHRFHDEGLYQPKE